MDTRLSMLSCSVINFTDTSTFQAWLTAWAGLDSLEFQNKVKPEMSTKPKELKRAFDRELNITDFRLVWEKAGILSGRWDSIGILLGISYNKLYEIKTGGKPPRTCLQKVFDCWLKRDYDYKSHGVPTLRMLCNSIKSNSGGADPALADEIAKEFNLTRSGGDTTSPVDTSSSKEATLAGELLVPTSTQSESLVIYIKKKSFEYSPENLTRLIGDLQEVYLDNMRFTKELFLSLNVSEVIDFIQDYIALLLSPRFRKTQTIKSIEKEFDHVKTMKQLFKALEKHVSWFNFELVVKLVNTFITEERDLQRKWSTYCEKLKDYFKNNDTQAVQIADSIEFGLTDIPGTKVMIAKVARDDYTLNDLYFFHKLIADSLEVPQYKFYFCTIEDGCMELKYSIPDFLYSVLFPLTNQQCHLLAEIGIITITCHEYVHEMKLLPENKLKKLHDSPIDIYDPLWYENTSTPLNEACWRGLKDEVQRLIDKTGLQERGKNGWSPPLAASYGGHIDVLCLLIDVYHCNPSQGDDDGVITLHMASYKGHLNIAQYLVNECHVDPDKADSSGNTGLLYSALGGHVDLVIMFLKKKCNVSQVNREGSTLSLLACKSGQVALVNQLKQFSIFSENDIDFNGCGIVHYCAMSESVELLKCLYKNHNINLKKTDRFGATPLHVACQYASSGFIMKMVDVYGYKVLLEADYSGRSSLHYLCSGLVDKYCITEVFNKLTAPCDIPFFIQNSTFYVLADKDWRKCISLNINVTKQHKRVSLLSTLFKKASVINNFNINSITATGQSLVHLACTSGSILLVKVLEEYGINTSSLDYEGRSAVHYAALSGSPTLLSYTVSQYSLNASQPDYKGVVPLALACMSGSINAVEYIINTIDIDINITCNEGRTPLHYSCRHGNVDLSQYLIEVQDSDINITDNNNNLNALTHSAWSGNMKLVKYLINNYHLLLTSIALHQAVYSTKLSLVKLLVKEYKLDPHYKSGTVMQAVHCAAQVGAVDVFEYLVKDCGCDLDRVGGVHNMNVFHYSTTNGHFLFIKYIINNYPQYTSLLHSTNENDALPIHTACISGVIPLVTFLIDVMKCDVTTEDKSGYTWTCFSHNLDLLKLLIRQYNLNPKLFSKSSSPEVAVMSGCIHILEWLRQEYRIIVASFKNGVLPFYAAQYNR
uniref:Death domain-containing protein n=1 Tax=Amphimedon queenslandica TaxID=400682 RepID=A0A1X7TSI5_AMPQE